LSICDGFHAKLVISLLAEIANFEASYAGLYEPRRSKLKLLKATFNAKYYIGLYADCLGLSPVIPAQFTLEICAATSNGEKITATRYFRV